MTFPRILFRFSSPITFFAVKTIGEKSPSLCTPPDFALFVFFRTGVITTLSLINTGEISSNMSGNGSDDDFIWVFESVVVVDGPVMVIVKAEDCAIAATYAIDATDSFMFLDSAFSVCVIVRKSIFWNN